MASSPGFTYTRQIRFHETDAAGVVYFANILVMCHEAFEASLAASDINVKLFFGKDDLATPVIHANVDFRRPLFCGDRVTIHLQPTQVKVDTFEIAYQLHSPPEALPLSIEHQPQAKLIATALTRHVCIATATRQRHPLSAELQHWMTQWSVEP